MITFALMALGVCGADSSTNIEGLDIKQTFIPVVDARNLADTFDTYKRRFIVVLGKTEFETVSNPSSTEYQALLQCANTLFDRMTDRAARIPLLLYNTSDDTTMAHDAEEYLNCAQGTACYAIDFQQDAESKAFTRPIPDHSGNRDFRQSCADFINSFTSYVDANTIDAEWFVPDYSKAPLAAP